jgi:4-hydroxy-tetrahydrodipicolinate synthase
LNTDITLHGLWPAMLTPLDEALNIDTGAFAAHALALLDAGCVGVTPFGTTGEGPSFSVGERLVAIDALVAAGVPPQRMLISTSCAALPDVIELTRHAVGIGAFACLMMPPFFLKDVPDQGVIDAYRAVIDTIADPRLRIMLYHIPQISGVALSPVVIRTLLTSYPETIIGLKDSGCDRDVSTNFAIEFMPPLQVWVGNEPDLQSIAAFGAKGAVSGIANILPQLVQRLVEDSFKTGADDDQHRVIELLDLLRGYGLTAALKAVMAIQHQHRAWLRVRPPLVALSETQFQRFAAQWREFAGAPPSRHGSFS